jgi:diketogulonate reductase-like aldo/keto reductase
MINASLNAIGYLDLLLLHFPCAAVNLAERGSSHSRWYGDVVAECTEVLEWREQTWRTMESFVQERRFKSSI